MSTNQADFSGVYAMLEEIKADIKSNNQRPAAEVDVEAVNRLAATMRETIEEARRSLTVEKQVTINFAGSRSVIFTLAAVIVAVVASITIPIQQKELSKRTDNDLKYRFIQMHGTASYEDILMLREVFDFNRNKDSIKVIRQRVELYEQLIQQQAESEARARLNAEDAARIEKEVENLKWNK